MQHLLRRRSLGQRLTDRLLVAVIFPFAFAVVPAVTGQDRKAAR